MKPTDSPLQDLLDLETHPALGERLWVAGKPESVRAEGGGVKVRLPFKPCVPPYTEYQVDTDSTPVYHELLVVAHGSETVRVTLILDGETSMACTRESEMLVGSMPSVGPALTLSKTAAGYEAHDADGRLRFRVTTSDPPVKKWSDLLPPPYEAPAISVFPDGKTEVALAAHDHFFRKQENAVPLGYVTFGERPVAATVAFESQTNECFAGTGERFAKMDLSGRTIELENNDALGVNNRRAYKNIPFFLSSRGYGVFLHTSAGARLSLADLSTRAVAMKIAEPALDLFVMGGGGVAKILQNYLALTGKPQDVPRFSYGIWMSRMTYFSDQEVTEIAERLRKEDFPCDVLHLDTGWFAKDWVCEWKFSEERFPDPRGFFDRMQNMGYKVTLWQTPNIGEGNRLLEEAKSQRYLAPRKTEDTSSRSDFSSQDFAGQIDFSNPRAVAWYQGLLRGLLQMGAAAIKTDFGETIDMWADYHALPAGQLRNLYALLYQRAASEVTREVNGHGLIWARSAWAGAQQYPVHWGGDCACTWEGMAGSLRGGLHLGLSGFAFWSHDVPGFHGLPDFMNNWPSDDLYVRWTQFGVFTSHLRYHGTSPREPYEYPEVAGVVRKWWKLRYALIPYLEDSGRSCIASGKPMLRALLVEHESDRTVWHIDDQYYFGDVFLVAPIMNAEGERDVYLPEGQWVDVWTGERLTGGRWLKKLRAPLERMPLYAKLGASISVYPEAVSCTGEMRDDRVTRLAFDGTYRGLSQSILGKVTGL